MWNGEKEVLRTEKLSKSTELVRQGRAYLDHPQVINVQNKSIFVGTWNVGGKSPSSNLNLDDYLHSSPPADIYVLGCSSGWHPALALYEHISTCISFVRVDCSTGRS